MSKSQRLRLRDVRQAYRLLGECRDLGADSRAWRFRLLEGLCELLGAQVALGGEACDFWTAQPQFRQTLDLGWAGEAERQRWLQYIGKEGPQGDILYQKLFPPPGPMFTRVREQLVEDAEWYDSVLFNEYFRVSRIDALIIAFSDLPQVDASTTNTINLFRALGERGFDRRERRLLHLIHEELAEMIGRQLAAAKEPSALDLPPRQQEVLRCLLQGASEKEIAVRLGLTPRTVHQYVVAIYRHFAAGSRGELLARWISRR